MQGTLSVVATPIGNLGDMTFRGVQTLAEADAIACEDTRVTAKLLTRYDLKKPLLVYHAQTPIPQARSTRLATGQGGHRRYKAVENILRMLGEGKRVALVTDAGTPGISDPGTELVALARERLGGDVRIEAIPGPSALTAALSIAGVPTDEFTFVGFLPHKKGRQTALKEIAEARRTYVFYESPHRIEKALRELEMLAPGRQLVVLRELTKLFESCLRGTPAELIAHFKAHPKEVRGEFVVVVPD